MGLKPLEPRQEQTRASSQQALLERTNYQSQTVAQPQSQALTQIGPTSAPSSSQIGRVQGANQNLVSPSANEHALANYGKASDRLHSGKQSGRAVASYAEIPSLDNWWQNYQSQSLSVGSGSSGQNHYLPSSQSMRPSAQDALRPRQPDSGASSLKGAGRLLQIKV